MTIQKTKSICKARVLAVASGGGHWVELMRLAPAFADADLAFVTVVPEYKTHAKQFPSCRFYVVPDVTRWNKMKWIVCASRLLGIIVKERPDVVITTGAMPGFLACRIARALGAKVIWVDSIANVEEMSKSGQLAGRFADLWLTQWKHLARPSGPMFRGAVL